MKYVLPLKIDFVKSHESYLFDKFTNIEYLDFFSMYSSLPLGYNHKIFDETYKEKINEISYIRMANNVCQSDELLEFVEIFKRYLFSEYMHLTCTGALAVESALKAAMEYKKVKNPHVISVRNSFHGVNSWGFTTSRVGVTAKRMENFPDNSWSDLELDDIISYLKNDDLSSLVAVIIEPIQATNGDIYLDINKLKEIRTLCTQKDICFILDEIQTGFGTTGKMWYYEHLDIIPDILIFGKKAQVCGICVSEKYSLILNNPYQKLDVTFDGELIDIIRAKYVLKAIEENKLLSKVIINSSKIKEILLPITKNYRSCGYLIAFDFDTKEDRDFFVEKCFQNKLLINKAGERTVRLRPNLALEDIEMEKFLEIVQKVISE